MRAETISTGSTAVDRMKDFPLTGHIVPNSWYHTIKFKNGKPDCVAIAILSDIVYWYRPTKDRDNKTGKLSVHKKKFAADKLQRSYDQLTDILGFTKDQARRAIGTLCDLGVITKEFKTIDWHRQKLPNVMYLDLNVDKLWEITYPDTLPDSNQAPPPLEQVPYPVQTGYLLLWNRRPYPIQTKYLLCQNRGQIQRIQ